MKKNNLISITIFRKWLKMIRKIVYSGYIRDLNKNSLREGRIEFFFYSGDKILFLSSIRWGSYYEDILDVCQKINAYLVEEKKITGLHIVLQMETIAEIENIENNNLKEVVLNALNDITARALVQNI